MTSLKTENRWTIRSCDEAAERLGLGAGDALADARAAHPGIDVAEADPSAEAVLLCNIADWCDRYTPLVACDAPDGLFLDISGCAHLFGGEQAMLSDARRRLFGQGFWTHGAVAGTPGMAWAAARFGGKNAVLANGTERAALAAMPCRALRIDEEALRGLQAVGMRKVGALLEAPRAPLARRFGRQLLLRLDQALGDAEEAIGPRLPVSPLSAERHLPEPVGETETLCLIAETLAQTLKGDMEKRGQGARRMELALFRVDGAVFRVALALSRPTREPKLISRLIKERLEALEARLDMGFGFDLLRLSVPDAEEYASTQSNFAGKSNGGAGEVAELADRAKARFGRETMHRVHGVGSHVPERATAMAEPDEPPPVRPMLLHPERPIHLFAPPERIEATAGIPDGPPVQFTWRRVLHRVARAEGPERIAPEWWLEGAGAGGLASDGLLTRDYFRIEDGDGYRFWLFRQGLYGETEPRWFLHGIFA